MNLQIHNFLYFLILIAVPVNSQYCNYCDCIPKNLVYICDCSQKYNYNCFKTSNNYLIESSDKIQVASDIRIPWIEELTFHNIHIEVLSFPEKLDRLKKLSLASCKINGVDKNTFYNSPHLKELSVVNNINLRLSSDTFIYVDNLYYLKMQNNSIRNIPNFLLENLKDLMYLDLAMNKIDLLNSDMFNENRKLEEIFLKGNNIKRLPHDVFNGLKNLLQIDLDQNKLLEIPNGLFNNLYKLQKIYLRYNNIATIGSEVFKNSSQIKEIYLNNNKIHYISTNTFSNLENLLEIDLSDNDLNILQNGLFKNLQKILKINLERNKITLIEQNSFENCPFLEQIYLDGNKIQQIDISILQLPYIKYISIPDSTITCDCNMKPFYTKYNELNISGDIKCSNNNTLSKLKEEELSCAPKVLQCATKYQTNETSITCLLYGNPLPNITWTNNEKQFENNLLYNINITYLEDNILWTQLIIRNESLVDNSYRIEAQNYGGFITHEIKLENEQIKVNDVMSINEMIIILTNSALVIIFLIFICKIIFALRSRIKKQQKLISDKFYNNPIKDNLSDNKKNRMSFQSCPLLNNVDTIIDNNDQNEERHTVPLQNRSRNNNYQRVNQIPANMNVRMNSYIQTEYNEFSLPRNFFTQVPMIEYPTRDRSQRVNQIPANMNAKMNSYIQTNTNPTIMNCVQVVHYLSDE